MITDQDADELVGFGGTPQRLVDHGNHIGEEQGIDVLGQSIPGERSVRAGHGLGEHLLGADNLAEAEKLAHVVTGRSLQSHQFTKRRQGHIIAVDAAAVVGRVRDFHVAQVQDGGHDAEEFRLLTNYFFFKLELFLKFRS